MTDATPKGFKKLVLEMAWIQAKFQSVVIPARVLRNFHSTRLLWKVKTIGTGKQLSEKLSYSIKQKQGECFIPMPSRDGKPSNYIFKLESVKEDCVTGDVKVEILSLTKTALWLDKISLVFKAESDMDGRLNVDAFCESTGFVPLSVPFAPLLNIVLCWIPFTDGDAKKITKRELELVQEHLESLDGAPVIETQVIKG